MDDARFEDVVPQRRLTLEARLAWCESVIQTMVSKERSGMNLNDYANEVYEANAQWWHDVHTGERIQRNKGEQLALIHSEISECLEGVRKGLMDDHLPHRTMEEVELADALIRIFDYAGGHGIDLHGSFVEKMAYNAERLDHKREHRAASGGKKF